MRRRASMRTAAVACVVALSLIVATSAAAGFKSGRYAGTTSQGTEISFKATKIGVVKKFSYSVDIECDDGTHPSTWEGAKAPIGDKGRFKAEFVTDDEDGTITSVVSGKLKRHRGSGTIETAGALPGGSKCHGSATWTAVRR